jgi:nicotinamidase-related amidase
MLALIVVDAQNEFSLAGQRPVPNHVQALSRIAFRVLQARLAKAPIAWVKHHNRPNESPAFVPGTWGAELSPGLGPLADAQLEKVFVKDVFGAFTTTDLHQWLRDEGVTRVLLVGFYAHMCVSTSAREALVRGFEVYVDPAATGGSDLEHELLGKQTAGEVRRAALLHLSHMGVKFAIGKELPAAANPKRDKPLNLVSAPAFHE